MEQQIKKPFYKKWWFWVPVVALLMIIGASGNNTQQSTPTSENTSVQTVSGQPKEYQEIFSFSGNGAKKSEPFTITGDRFKIAYDCKGDPNLTMCQAFVYKVGSNLPQGAVMNTPSATKDETVIYGKGEYYIDANIIGSFSMKIYDYR